MDANAIGTWLGVFVSIAGFVIAIWQIRKAESAVHAATEAIRATELRIGRRQLLVVLTQLQQVDVDLTAALELKTVGNVRVLFVRWRQLASESRGLLRGTGLVGSELSLALERSVAFTTSADAPSLTADNIATRTLKAKNAIGIAVIAISEFVGHARVYTEDNNHD